MYLSIGRVFIPQMVVMGLFMISHGGTGMLGCRTMWRCFARGLYVYTRLEKGNVTVKGASRSALHAPNDPASEISKDQALKIL